jgi:uncharacterized repeat protein (TIGR01451 family)
MRWIVLLLAALAGSAIAQLIPPMEFPSAQHPAPLQKLIDAAAAAQKNLKSAQDGAAKRLESDAKFQELTRKFEDAKSALDAALASGEDVQNAAQRKMEAGSDVTTYTHDKVAADPIVAQAQQAATAADNAVNQWIEGRHYSSADDIVQMVPALKWLTRVANMDRYLWVNGFFLKVNAELDKVVNKHPAQFAITVHKIETGAPAAETMVVEAEPVKMNHLTVNEHATVPADSTLSPGTMVELRGLLQASAQYQDGGFILDVDFADAQVLKTNLTISSSVDNSTPNVGTNVTYTIKVSNAVDSAAATNLKLKNSLSGSQDLLSSAASSGELDNGGSWLIPSLPAGSSATLTLTARTADFNPLNDTVKVISADQPNSAAVAPSVVNVEPRQIRLSMNQQADNNSPTIGDLVTLTVSLSNDINASTATGVLVSDPMPEGLTFQSSNPSQGTYDPKTGIWSVGIIAAGQNATLAVTCMTSEKGAVDVPAAVTASDEPDANSTPKSNVSVDVQARHPPPQPQAQQNMPPWLIPVGAAVVLLVIVIMRR